MYGAASRMAALRRGMVASTASARISSAAKIAYHGEISAYQASGVMTAVVIPAVCMKNRVAGRNSQAVAARHALSSALQNLTWRDLRRKQSKSGMA